MPKDLLEGAVLELLSEKLLNVDLIESILEEFRAQVKEAGTSGSGRTKDVDRQIRRVSSEMRNLTEAIKAGGPIQDFVEEYKACGSRKTELEKERKELLKGSNRKNGAQKDKCGHPKLEEDRCKSTRKSKDQILANSDLYTVCSALP